MDVEPAKIEQVRQAEDGDWVLLSAESGTVAGDLQRIDKGLKVRFSKSGECWVIFHEHHPDCPHNGTGGPGSTYLVNTCQAYLSDTGIWTGLDDRVVKRIEFINPDGRGGYDFAQALEDRRNEREKREADEFHEKVGEAAEELAQALRKDLHLGPYKGRVFVNKKEAA